MRRSLLSECDLTWFALAWHLRRGIAKYLDPRCVAVRILGDVATKAPATGAAVKQPENVAADLMQSTALGELALDVGQESLECLVARVHWVRGAKQL